MTDNTAIAKDVFAACMNKDEKKIRELFDASYSLKDPIMSLNGVDALIEMVKSCPSDGKMSEVEYIAQGDKVVSLFSASQGDGRDEMRMCSIMTFRNGKVVAEEMIYDTSKLPPEMLEQVRNARKPA